MRKENKNNIETINKELSIAISNITKTINEISKGDYSARLKLRTNNPLLIELESKLNSLADDMQNIIAQYHELAIDISTHYEVLKKISEGDLSVRALEDLKNELTAQLGKLINKGIKNLLVLVGQLKKAEEQDKSNIEYLQDIIEFLPDATFVIDKDKKVIAWNKAIEDLTGVKKTEVIGKGDYAYSVPFYGHKRPALIDLLNASGENIENLFGKIERKSNTIIGEMYIPSIRGGKGAYLWAIASHLFDRNGNRTGAIESIRDITEFKENEQLAINANQKLKLWAKKLEHNTKKLTILNEMGELIQTCMSIDEAYDIISQSMQKLFPSFAGCVYMMNDSKDLLSNVSIWGDHLLSENSFNPNGCWAIRRNKTHISEAGNIAARCKHLSKEFSGNYICLPLIAHGEIIGLLHLQAANDQFLISDLEITGPRQQLAITIAEHISLSLFNIKLRERLREQAVRDHLTGLFNRRYMEETLEREIQRAKRNDSTLGLIMLDIDHFKRFNDTFGHAAGDAILREIASFIKSHIRMEDIASRYGGEEFLITMPDASLEITKERAEKLRQEVKKLMVDHYLKPLGAVTLSCGVSVFPAHGRNGETLIKAADKALYKAKAEGRDKVVVAE